LPVASAVIAALAVGGAAAVAVSELDNNAAIGCAAGADLIVHPGGTWDCGTPGPGSTPTPSSDPTTSAAPSTGAPATSAPPTGPSSTLPPAGLTGCWADPGKCGFPTPQTTGVPAGTALSAYTGPSTIRGNTTIEGKTLGCLRVNSGNVTIRKSRITCAGGIGLEVDGSAVVTIEDTEINCVTGLGTGIDRSPSGSFAARRLYIHDCENGLHMEGGTSVEDSYIMVRTVGGAHSDGIQGVSGSNIVIRHNTILNAGPGGTSSIIFAGQNMPGLIVADNLLSGGAYTVYCPPSGNATYSGNRFAAPIRSALGPEYGFTSGCGRAGITWTNNVRDDTGAIIGTNA